MANGSKPQQHHYTFNCLPWLICTETPPLHTDYVYFIHEYYQIASIRLDRFAVQKILHINIYFTQASLAGWLVGCLVACLAGCHSMCAMFSIFVVWLGAREYEQTQVRSVSMFIAALRCSLFIYDSTMELNRYVSKHRKSNYQSANGMVRLQERLESNKPHAFTIHMQKVNKSSEEIKKLLSVQCTLYALWNCPFVFTNSNQTITAVQAVQSVSTYF